MLPPPETQLHLGAEQILLAVRGETVALYRQNHPVPGFTALFAAGERPLTPRSQEEAKGLWLAHPAIEGGAFGIPAHHPTGPDPADPPPSGSGQIVSEEVIVRRGRFSVGFRQSCLWIAPQGRPLLREERTFRLAPGAAEGAVLDISVQLQTATEEPVRFGEADGGLLWLQVASALTPAGGGQMRSSRALYDPEAMHQSNAAWCGAIGVVGGAAARGEARPETVGLVLLDHPDNPGHPASWHVSASGVLWPSVVAGRAWELSAHRAARFHYRLLTHRGYVDQGWGSARLAAFAREAY